MAVSSNSTDSVVLLVCYFLGVLAPRRLLYMDEPGDSRADCRERAGVICGGPDLRDSTGRVLLWKGFIRRADFRDDGTFVGIRAWYFSLVRRGKTSKGEAVG